MADSPNLANLDYMGHARSFRIPLRVPDSRQPGAVGGQKHTPLFFIVLGGGGLVLALGALALVLLLLPDFGDARGDAEKFLAEVRTGSEPYPSAGRQFDSKSASSAKMLPRIRRSAGTKLRSSSVSADLACVSADLTPSRNYVAMRMLLEDQRWKVVELSDSARDLEGCEDLETNF